MTEREKTRSRAIMCSKIRDRIGIVVGVFLCRRVCFVHSQTLWQFVSWENEFQGIIQVPVFTECSRAFWCTANIQKLLLLLSRSSSVRDQFLTSPSVAHRFKSMCGPNSKMRTQNRMITGHIHEVYARQCNNKRLRHVL